MSEESESGTGRADVIDPELLRRFSLFRDAPPASAAPLEEDDHTAIRRFVSSPAGERFGLSTDDAKKVVVGQGLAVLVLPGRDGVSVLMLEPGSGGTGFSGFWASTNSVVAGHPVCSIGAILIGLAPDGVAPHPVVLADGVTVYADVVQNVYAIEDPARAH